MSNKMLTFCTPFSIEKSTDNSEEFVISGYANTTEKDRVGDVIPKDAWENGALKNYLKNPIILAFHNHTKPIGKARKLIVDENGLRIEATISKTATEIRGLIEEGILKSFSVGFIFKDGEYDKKTDTFKITELELLEVSVVSVPANQDSTFSLAKSLDSKELEKLKQLFIKNDEPDKTVEQQLSETSSQEEKDIMTKEELEKLVADASKAAAENASKATAEILQTGKSGTEKLLDEIVQRFEKRINETEENSKSAISGLEAIIKEKADELERIQKSKMLFRDSEKEISYQEKETAFILAKATGRKLEETKYFHNLVEKVGGHVASADWELTISTNMQEEIRQRLVVVPLLPKNVPMSTPVMRLPVNPEAGYATWVTAGAYMTTDSSGAAQTHQLKEITLTSHKVATKEFIGNEEDEDAILAIVPIVRDAMVRRMAKAIDKGHLRGAGAGTDPIKGLTVYQASTDNVTVTTSAKVTVANLQAVRRKLGVWGLDPSDVVYIVSQDVYYDLLDDTTFQTMDKVGDRATILRGQIGSCNGSPVIVSAEFAAKAGGTAGSIGAIALNSANFLRGTQRGLRLESDYQVIEQQRVFVASERLAFQQISTVDGHGVSALRWT